MPKRLILMLTLLSSVGVHSADAAGQLAAGPVVMGENDYFHCVAVNVGTKPLAEVKVEIFRTLSKTPELDQTCTNLLSHDQCGFQSIAFSPGYRTCVVTVTGPKKSVRGNICNSTDNICFPLD